MTSLLPEVFAAHHARVATALSLSAAADYFATYWLQSLASPTGNDILQEVAVTATGRVNSAAKHGADSADGELEAKPFRRKYAAHISDDTPRSLLRHHSIPFVTLLQASADGRQIQWALLTSYHIFDEARAKGMGLTEGEVLPMEPVARRTVLQALEAARAAGKYVRNNPLPFSCVARLEPGQYDVWVNPEWMDGGGSSGSGSAEMEAIRQLAERNIGMSAAFVAETRALMTTLA